jgi:hypothetical protein
MKNLDHDPLYRDYILLIVYSYISASSISYQGILSTEHKGGGGNG